MSTAWPAPITYVSQTQVTFLIPFATQPIAAISVMNNGTASNTVTSYMTQDFARSLHHSLQRNLPGRRGAP